MLKRLWQTKNFRVFCFTTFNALIVLLITWIGKITDPNILIFAPFLVAFMNAITKFINISFFNDIGVQKEDLSID